MPLLTRWVIKTSFVYLGIALAIGILLAGQSLWHLPVVIAALFPDYIHLLVVGWLTLLIFGRWPIGCFRSILWNTRMAARRKIGRPIFC